MTDLNTIILVGRLTADIEIKYTQGGFAIGQFSIAVNESRKQQDGSYKDETSFFNCKAIGKTAESIQKYFKKGSKILLQGSLKQERWTSKQDGSNQSKIIIDVDKWSFMDSVKKDDNQSMQYESVKQVFQGKPVNQNFINDPWSKNTIGDDNIPF